MPKSRQDSLRETEDDSKEFHEEASVSLLLDKTVPELRAVHICIWRWRIIVVNLTHIDGLPGVLGIVL